MLIKIYIQINICIHFFFIFFRRELHLFMCYFKYYIYSKNDMISFYSAHGLSPVDEPSPQYTIDDYDPVFFQMSQKKSNFKAFRSH